MKLTIEELLTKLLELADKHGGHIETNVTEVIYQNPSNKSDGFPRVFLKK